MIRIDPRPTRSRRRMNLLYTATAADLGVSLKFGKAALGLMVAWAMNYL